MGQYTRWKWDKFLSKVGPSRESLKTYPTKKEVRKIIDSKVRADLVGEMLGIPAKYDPSYTFIFAI